MLVTQQIVTGKFTIAHSFFVSIVTHGSKTLIFFKFETFTQRKSSYPYIWKKWGLFMNLMKKTAVVLWAIAWVVAQTAKDLIISYVDVMRTALGEDGRPISIAAFVAVMVASVFLMGITGTLIAVLKVN